MPSLSSMRVIRSIETRATTTGVAETTAALKSMAGAHADVGRAATESARVTETSARGQATIAGAYERTRRQLDPLIAAQDKFERTMRTLDRAHAAGQSSLEEHTRLVGLARGRFDALTGANDNLTKSVGLQRHEWTNLGRQMQDIGTMAAMGASGMQILTSQAAQVYDVLASSRGGLGGALKEIGSGFLGLLTPARLAFGGVVAGAATAVAAMASVLSQQEEIERRLSGIGRASGMTARDVNRIATRDAIGAGQSVGEARDALATFGSTGRIGQEIGAGLLPIGTQLSKMLGVDLTAANELLAKAFADPAKGADTLNERLGNLNDSTRRTIELQMAAGDRLGAQRILMDSVASSTAGATDKLSLWTSAWIRAKGVLDSVGQATASILAPSIEDQIASTERRIQDLMRSRDPNRPGNRGGFGIPLDIPAAQDPALPAERERLRKLQEDLSFRTISEAAEVESAAEAQRSRDAGERIRPYLQEQDAIEKLRAELKALDDLRRNRPADIPAERIEEAYRRAEGAVSSTMSAEEKRRASDELSIRSITARTDAERAAIAVRQKEIELSGQAFLADERKRALDAAREQELARATRAADDRLRASNDNAALSGLLPYQRGRAEIEQRFRRQNEENTGNPEALRRNAQVRENELRAFDQEQLQAPFRATTMSINEQVAALEVQRKSLFATDEAAAAMAARQEMVNQAIRAGVPEAQAYGGKLDELAAQMGKVKVAGEEFARTRQGIVGGLDETRSAFSGTLSGVVGDLRNRRDPMQGILTSLTRYSDQLMERTLFRPLTEQLLGKMGSAGGGLFGDLIGKSGIFGTLTGAPTSIQTPVVTITAATVSMGGVAGLGGLGLGATPGSGSPLTGAGSGLTGFGLGGATEAGSAARLGSGLSMFGLGANGTTLGGLGTSAALDMIMKHESGGRNILQQAVGPNGGYNPSTGTITGPSSASGYFQMINGTWRNAAGMVGIDTQQYPTAMSAPYELQRKAAGALFEKEGFAPWAPYNAALRADIARQGGAGAFGKRADLEPVTRSLETSTDTATKSMADLSTAAGQIPAGTDAATSGLTSLASSLLSFKPGGGGGFGLANLFGGGSGGGSFADGATTWSANGNVMTRHGPIPLNMYAGGGIATSPQLSIFGEGRLPEAYVPLPDGRSIPVTMRDARATPPAANANGPGSSPLNVIVNEAPGVRTSVRREGNTLTIDQVERNMERRFAGRLDRSDMGPAVRSHAQGGAAERVG